jgi:PadR family transcriptional regulator PadR
MTTKLPRVTAMTLRVLTVLLENAGHSGTPEKKPEHRGEIYALALARSANVRVGSVYPILARLEKHNWVTGEWESENPALPGRPRRRFYRLTTGGAAEAQLLLEERQILSRQDQRETQDQLGVEPC